jgi:hypothetical protein
VPADPAGTVTRRNFLLTALGGTATALLAACRGSATSEATGTTTTTVDLPTGTSASAGATAQTAATGAPAATTPAVPPAPPVEVPGMSVVLGRPTDRSVAVSLLADRDRTVRIRPRSLGGAAGTADPVDVSLRAGRPQHVELTGLTPATAHAYELVVDGVGAGERTFHTQRARGETFTFTIDADPHYTDTRFDGAQYRSVLRSALADRPDFHIDLGDTFMSEKAKATTEAMAEPAFSELRSWIGELGGAVPFFLATGNHEGELGWPPLGGSGGDLALWSTRLRQRYYPCPAPGGFYSGATVPDPKLGAPRDSYYAWTWGDCQFLVLDPFWYTTVKPPTGVTDANWGWTLGEAQYRWMVDTLERSTARHKLVFIHHLVGGGSEARGGVEVASGFEWGGRNADGSPGFDARRKGWGRPIHQVLVDTGVEAVFRGHDHVYVHQQLDGIVYQLLPQPSSTQLDNSRLAAEYGYRQGTVVPGSGYLRATVSPASVAVEFVRCRPGATGPGETAHRFDLVPRR